MSAPIFIGEHMFVGVLDRVSREVGGLSPAGAPRLSLVDTVAALGRLRGVLDAVESRFLAAVDSLDDSGLDAAGVVRSVTSCSGREALRRSRRAAALAEMGNVAAGLASGAIPVETIDSLVRAADLISPEEVDGDPKLLQVCATRPADIASRQIRDWIREHQCPVDSDAQLKRQRDSRRASWFINSAGMIVCNIEFDPVTGAAVRARFEAETDVLWRSDGGRDGRPDQIRTPAQRRCDAVARLLGVASPHADDASSVAPQEGRVATTVVIVADLGVIDGTSPSGRCEIIDTGPIPASVLAHLPADTTWQGALFDGPGRPLWLGRGRRLANQSQRLISAVRDRGCVNCNAPTNRCHTHHIREWQHGGTTDIDMLVLLCPRCHTLLHEGHIRLYRQPDHTWAAAPVRAGPTGAPKFEEWESCYASG